MRTPENGTVAKGRTGQYRWLNGLTGASGVVAGVLLSAGVVDITFTDRYAANGSRGLQNWLSIIVRLHAGVSGLGPDPLHVLNGIDIAIMVLMAAMFAGLYSGVKGTRRVWWAIAMVVLLMGIVLFAVTRLTGRSAVMVAVPIVSAAVLPTTNYPRALVYGGILTGTLLLAADVGLSFGEWVVLAVAGGAGYALLTAWTLIVGGRLAWLGRHG